MERDRRLTPARPDLADLRLKGEVVAERFVAGAVRRVIAPVLPLRRAPRPDAPLDTEALRGEAVTIFEDEEGWAWGQLARDGYVGYLPSIGLGPARDEPTHRVAAIRTFLYPGPDLKLPVFDYLPFGAEVALAEEAGDYARLQDGSGYVFGRHLTPIAACEPDPVAVAERFLGIPYLWGGKSSLGLDCSGLVQTALAACGIAAPRDTDMQEQALGSAILLDSGLGGLERGDLVFWKGHVGLMRDEATLIHANGYHMAVASEPLAEAEERIRRASFGAITSVRRL